MQLYQPYEQKILRLAEIKAKIMRYKYLILACILAIIGGVSTLLYFKGDIQKDISLKTEYIYGETITYHSKAFLSDSKVEFYQNNQAIDSPVAPGHYTARVVARGAFGIRKYGQWHSFFIRRRTARFIMENTVVYGDYPQVSVEGLLASDKAVTDVSRFRYVDILQAQPKVEVRSGCVTIYNANNQDVTHCYIFEKDIEGTHDIHIQPRNITLSTGSVEKVYDGTVTDCQTYQIQRGKLAFKDQLQTGAYPCLEGVGEIENQTQFSFYNQDGLDVGALYNVRYEYGTLKVTPKAMSISTQDVSKVCDFNPFPIPQYQAEGLIDGHTVQVLRGCLETQPGVYKNLLEYDIVNAQETSVKDNYEIDENWGKAVIYSQEIIVSLQGSKTYDGRELTDCTPVFIQGSIAPDETFVIKNWCAYDGFGNTVPVKNAGEYRAEILDYEIQSPRENAQDYYLITLQEGTCTVSKRPITVRLQDKIKYYDRSALTSNTVQVTEGSLVTGHVIEGQGVGSITAPGSVTNALASVSIKENGVPVTDNYQVTKVGGALTVLKRKVTIYPLPLTKTYDGTPLSYPDGIASEYYAYVRWTYGAEEFAETTGEAVLSGDQLKVDYVGLREEMVNVGTTDILVNGYITDAFGGSLEAYYEVTLATGMASITPARLQIVSLSHHKVYDGTPLTGKADDCYIAIGKLCNGETIVYTVEAEQTQVGSCKNAITKVEIWQGAILIGYAQFHKNGTLVDGNDAGYNYIIEIKCGTLQVTKAP